MKKLIFGLLIICSVAYASKQFGNVLMNSLGIAPTTNGAGLVAGTIFSVQSTTKSSIPSPVMTETQRDALTNLSTGQQIFNSTTGAPNYYANAIWNRNNLTNKTAGVLGMEACKINNITGTPTVDTASGLCAGWVSALIDTGVGVTGITITAGIFSVVPVCTCTPEVVAGGGTNANKICDITITSNTSLSISIRTSGGAQDDQNFTIQCLGKR